MYTFCEIPIEPRGKGRPRFTRAGHTYTPKETAAYERTVREWYARHVRDRLTGPLRVSLNFLLPIPASWSASKRAAAANGQIMPEKKPDIDNLVKAVLDALNGVAWYDDKQIVDIVAQKRYSALPRVCIDIEEVKGDETAESIMDGGTQDWREAESGEKSQTDEG